MEENTTKYLAKSIFCLMSFFSGLPFIWGNISLYVYTYYLKDDFENNFGLMNFGFLFTILFTVIGSIMNEILCEKFPKMLVILFSIVVVVFALFIILIVKDVYLFVFLFNVVISLFIGIIRPIPFNNLKGLLKKEERKNFQCLLMIFSGLNPFLLNFMAFKLWNPNNVNAIVTPKMYMYMPSSVSDNFFVFFETLAIIYLILAVVILIGLVFVKKIIFALPNEHILMLENEEKKDGVCKALFSKDSLRIFFMAIFSSIFMEYFMVYYKEIGFSNYNDDLFLSGMGATSLLILRLGYIFWKTFSTKINNVFLPLTIILIIQSLIGFLFKFSSKLEGLLFFMNCLIFFLAGGQYAVYELMARRRFKDKFNKRIFVEIGKLAFVLSLLLVVLIHYIFFENIGFNNLIIVMTLFGFLTFIFFL